MDPDLTIAKLLKLQLQRPISAQANFLLPPDGAGFPTGLAQFTTRPRYRESAPYPAAVRMQRNNAFMKKPNTTHTAEAPTPTPPPGETQT